MTGAERQGGEETPGERAKRILQMPLSEVEERLGTISSTFTDVETHYSGLIGRLRRNLKEEDLSELRQAVDDLALLGFNHNVQDQILEAGRQADNPETVFNRIGPLHAQVQLFMARFDNTGITIVQHKQT